MKKFIKKIYLLFTVGLLMASCTKISGDKDHVPQPYWEVAIEGSLNLQLNIQGSCSNVFAMYTDFSNMGLPNTKSLEIQGRDDQNRMIHVLLYFNSLPLDGIFNLGIDDQTITYGGMGQYKPNALDPSSIFYSTDDINTGKCTITNYNQSTQTISGNFDFTGQGYDPSGAVLAGVTAHFHGTFNDVPINDLTDPNNPKGVCFGSVGTPLGTGGGTGGGGTGGGGTGGGGQTSTITFMNPTFTPIDITFNGQNKTAPVGGSAVFTGTANAAKTGNASTSGKTSNGTLIGLPIVWNNINLSFPAAGGNLNYTLNIGPDFFFLKMVNTSTLAIQKVYVNYGLQSQTLDNISIPNNGNTYGTGYYKAFSNSNVRAENGNIFWFWNPLNLPFTNNQSKTVQAN